MSTPSPPPGDVSGVPVCYRHTSRESHIRCQRCNRPICPDCMRAASVGFQCPSCVNEGSRATRSGRTPFGGLVSGRPALTSQILIALNVAVWVLIMVTGGSRSAWVYRLALLPERGLAMVDGRPEAFPGVADGAYWQLVTSMFTHVEIWHIGFNMVALWVLGPQLEMVLGRARFLAVYFLAGLGGSATVYWLSNVHTPTIGASGALFGLMGALLVVAIRAHGNVSQIGMWIGLNFVITVVGRGFISWQGHLGGFLGGVLVAVLLVYAPRLVPRPASSGDGRAAALRRAGVQWAGVALVAVAIVVAVAARTVSLA